MRVLLIIAFATAACATTRFPPPQAHVEYYHPRVEQIMERLRMAIPEKDRPAMLSYRVWSAPNPTVADMLATEPDTGIIYIHTAMLRISDDVLAVGLGHEIYHVLEHRGIKKLAVLGWFGGSAGAGITVGHFTTWWIGLLTGGGTFLIAAPPIILAGIRSGEDRADQFGIELTERAGFNTRPAVQAWCQFHIHGELDMIGQGIDPDTKARTHPAAQERCQSMRAALSRAQYSR